MKAERKSWRIKGSYNGKLPRSILPTAKGKKLNPLKTIVTDKKGNVTEEYRSRFRYLGNLLKKNDLTFLPDIEVEYPTKMNLTKDFGYVEEKMLANKYDVGRDSILSLAGGRPLHISLMLGQEKGLFHTFVEHKKDFQELFPYCASLRYQTGIDFGVKRQDILTYMLTATQKYDLFDLDFFATIPRMVDQIVIGLQNCAKERVLLGITHTMRGMSGQEKKDVYIARKRLIKKLGKYFTILDGIHTYYYNSTVMFREVFILERKAA